MPQVMTGSLAQIATTHALRCDSKQFEPRYSRLDAYLDEHCAVSLGEYLPGPLVKGKQPQYANDDATEGIPVITTLAVQRLRIDVSACRLAEMVDYGPDDARKPRLGDVLLTVDGGPSIGKAAVFDLDGDYAIDSHVMIMRPQGLDPQLLAYLLTSPICQAQFRRFESGASGQTAINEEDIRRVRVPAFDQDHAVKAAEELTAQRAIVDQIMEEAARVETEAWSQFVSNLTSSE